MPDQDSNPPPLSSPDATGDTTAVVSAVNEKIEKIEAPPMIEVHEPHEAIHSWKDILIHIGIISIGLLIAIGLDETVVYFHHQNQAHQLEESLRQESLANRDVVKFDIASIDTLIENTQLNMANLDRARMVAGKYAFVYIQPQIHGNLLYLSNTAWLAVRDGGSLSLLPSQITDDYWQLDTYGGDQFTHKLADVFKEYKELESLLHLHGDISVKSPEEKQQVLSAFARMNGDTRDLLGLLLVFNDTNEIALSGEKYSGAKLRELIQHEPPAPTY
jgi:hypothetical protein